MFAGCVCPSGLSCHVSLVGRLLPNIPVPRSSVPASILARTAATAHTIVVCWHDARISRRAFGVRKRCKISCAWSTLLSMSSFSNHVISTAPDRLVQTRLALRLPLLPSCVTPEKRPTSLHSKSHAVALSASFASESLLAMPRSSIPAPSLGLSVAHLLTCAATWVQRWDASPARRRPPPWRSPRPVADGHLGDPEHERGPCRGAFRLGEMPGDDAPVRDRYGHDGFPAKPDPVENTTSRTLAGGIARSASSISRAVFRKTRRPADPEVGDRFFLEQPSQKRSQGLCGVVDRANRRCSAPWAAPPPCPCFGRPVPLHLGAAYAASRIVHPRFLSLGNFLHGKACLTRHVKGKSDTLSETPESWTETSFGACF